MDRLLGFHNFVVLGILLSVPCSIHAGSIVIKPHHFYKTIYDDEAKDFVFNLSLQLDFNEKYAVCLKCDSSDNAIAEVTNDAFIFFENVESNISMTVNGHFLGETLLTFSMNKSLNGTSKGDNADWYEYTDKYRLVVMREGRPIDTAFTVSVIILVCLANVAMGCKTDVAVVKATLKRPIAPLTGLASQFLLMPMVGIMC